MPYVTREDGERFVVPSYREILDGKNSAILKKEIYALSENHGVYACIIKKSGLQYEVAFSPDNGYLLGETVWQYFKRPFDLIYCETIPNTTEAILVIVKSGNVFLDGSFPIDSIAEELVVFQTQKNNFDIHVYGDVPISQTPEEGKFSFDATHVKSFNVLSQSALPKLPKIKAFQLQLIDTALKSQGIGVYPVKKIVVALVILGLLWMAYTYITTHKKELPQIRIISVISPYQSYVSTLTSPEPYQEVRNLEHRIIQLFSMPGWYPESLDYANGLVTVKVKSLGAPADILLAWAKKNGFSIEVKNDGFALSVVNYNINRIPPDHINPLNDVIASISDRIALVLPGNHLSVGAYANKITYYESKVTISFDTLSVGTLDLLAQQLRKLPLVLNKVSITFSNGTLAGTIELSALGN